MSWDKNTISFSDIDAVIDALKDIGIDYKLSVLTRVVGRGLNDDYMGREFWELRRLEYGNTVYLEKIEQDAECDTDDIITSHKFTKSTEPKDWVAIIQTDKTGEYTEGVE